MNDANAPPVSWRIVGAIGRVFRRASATAILLGFIVATVAFAGIAAAGMPRVGLALMVASVACALPFLWAGWSIAKLAGRLEDAVDRWDADEIERVHRALDGDGPPVSALDRELRKIGRAEELLVRERYEEARRVYASIEHDLVPTYSRPGLLGGQAYATALAGHADAALALARRALDEAMKLGDAYSEAKLWTQQARHGVVLSLADRHDEALAEIGPLLDDKLRPSLYTSAAYHYARSLDVLGEHERARGWLENVAELGGPWAARARSELAAAGA
ncbi:MAG TPA: hypothetical protein VIF62_39440 [Labilithrix sp.]